VAALLNISAFGRSGSTAANIVFKLQGLLFQEVLFICGGTPRRTAASADNDPGYPKKPLEITLKHTNISKRYAAPLKKVSCNLHLPERWWS
jgi:hypothetical protein